MDNSEIRQFIEAAEVHIAAEEFLNCIMRVTPIIIWGMRGNLRLMEVLLPRAEHATWLAEKLEQNHGFYQGIRQVVARKRTDNMVYRVDMGNYNNHMFRVDIWAATVPTEWEQGYE